MRQAKTKGLNFSHYVAINVAAPQPCRRDVGAYLYLLRYVTYRQWVSIESTNRGIDREEQVLSRTLHDVTQKDCMPDLGAPGDSRDQRLPVGNSHITVMCHCFFLFWFFLWPRSWWSQSMFNHGDTEHTGLGHLVANGLHDFNSMLSVSRDE